MTANNWEELRKEIARMDEENKRLKAENADLKQSLEQACLFFAKKGDCCNCPMSCESEITIGECKERLIDHFLGRKQ